MSLPVIGGGVGLPDLNQYVEMDAWGVKSSEEIMGNLEAFDLTGSLRSAADLAGWDHKTVVLPCVMGFGDTSDLSTKTG